MNYFQIPRGLELYKGLSLFNGEEVVVIATFFSENRATGPMVQVWFLPTVTNPLKAIYETKDDEAVCGSCPLREKVCYVNPLHGLINIYKSWKEENYPQIQKREWKKYFEGRYTRIGAYGDAACAPSWITRKLVKYSVGYTCYTHFWQEKRFQWLKKYAMASVHSEEEARLAKLTGWRYFRMKDESENKIAQEIICPKSKEAGHRKQCIDCLLCSGTEGIGSTNIVINVHGWTFKKKNFGAISDRKLPLELIS